MNGNIYFPIICYKENEKPSKYSTTREELNKVGSNCSHIICMYAVFKFYYFAIYLMSYLGSCCCGTSRDQTQLGEGRVHFILQHSGHTLSLREVREETQGGNVETGTEAGATEKYF